MRIRHCLLPPIQKKAKGKPSPWLPLVYNSAAISFRVFLFVLLQFASWLGKGALPQNPGSRQIATLNLRLILVDTIPRCSRRSRHTGRLGPGQRCRPAGRRRHERCAGCGGIRRQRRFRPAVREAPARLSCKNSRASSPCPDAFLDLLRGNSDDRRPRALSVRSQAERVCKPAHVRLPAPPGCIVIAASHGRHELTASGCALST